MAKRVRPWLTNPDTNHERKVRPSDEASTSEFHQGQRNHSSSLEGRMYGCNLYPATHYRELLGKPGSVHVWFVVGSSWGNRLIYFTNPRQASVAICSTVHNCAELNPAKLRQS